MNYQSFDQVLRAYLDAKDNKEGKEHKNDWWWASELGFCHRKQFLRRLGIPYSEEKEWRIRFLGEDGSAAHYWRESAAGKMGVLIESEGSLESEEYRWRGRFDLIVRLNDRLVLIDIKTQRPEAFFRRSKKPEGARVEYFQKLQLASYVFFARNKYPDLKEARIYYIDRGGGLREEYSFIFDAKIFKKITQELNTLNYYWKMKQIPVLEKVPKWQCRYCAWVSICKKVEKDNLNLNQVLTEYGNKKQAV